MANIICMLCLRTEITPKPIGIELSNFIYELCEYEGRQNSKHKLCSCCVYLLKKFYNFKMRCLKAYEILKSIECDSYPSNLHEQMTSSLGLCNTLPPFIVMKFNDELYTHIQDFKANITIGQNIPSNKDPDVQDTVGYMQQNYSIKVEEVDSESAQLIDADFISTNFKYNSLIENNYLENFNGVKSVRELACEPNNSSEINDNENSSFSQDIRNFDDESDMDTEHIKPEMADPIQVDERNISDSDDTLGNDTPYNDKSNEIEDTDNSSPSEDEKIFLKSLKEKKFKPIIAQELNNLQVAETLLQMHKKNKILRERVNYLRIKKDLKKMILKLFVNDTYDLGDSIIMTKEVFLKIYEKCDKTSNHYNKIFVNKHKLNVDKVRVLLRFLLNRYNPEYETVFNIEYLDTYEKKLQEFNQRKETKQYKTAPFKCELCYRGFTFESVLKKHSQKHKISPGERACQICSLKIPPRTPLSHSVGPCHRAVYACKLCPLVTYYPGSMANHFDQHKGAKHRCEVCQSEYSSKTTLANHARSHATLACPHCAHSFVSAVGLAQHITKKHKNAQLNPDNTVSCDDCKTTFHSLAVLKKHMKLAHTQRTYRCVCNERFSSMTELVAHKRRLGHAREPGRPRAPYLLPEKPKGKDDVEEITECPLCKMAVPNRYALYRHYVSAHPTERYVPRHRPKHLCTVCGKGFACYQHLLDHANAHSGARPYRCAKCPKSFATSVGLWRHRERHLPPRHECATCGKKFKSRANLYSHERAHAGDRRFACGACAKAFLHRAALNEHVRGVHLNIRRARKDNKK